MVKVRRILVRWSPEWLVTIARSYYLGIQRFRLAVAAFEYDRRHFLRHYGRQVSGATLVQLESRLTFHSHALEKGLSHTNLRVGFGELALKQLAEALHEYRGRGFSRARLPYVNAISTLNAYVETHRKLQVDLEYLERILGVELAQEAYECDSRIGGVLSLRGSLKTENSQKNFEDLFSGRVSVREFASSPMSVERIRPAIQLARKAPSVCNRQACRVSIVTDQGEIGSLLGIQGGFTGYPNPPALLAVTTDVEAFLAPTERNQSFVDGGIFSMAILLALEFYGIAACPLNAMLTPRAEKSVLQRLGLPASHRVVVFIALGEFPDVVKVPKSFRVGLPEVLVNDISLDLQ